MSGEATAEGKSLRIAGFARFFKSYMSVSAIVAAAVPIPVASLKLIPTYAAQRGYLSVYSSLFCFLLVAFVFSIRHGLGRRIFYTGKLRGSIAVLPALAIVLCVGCIAGYHLTLQHSLETWSARGVAVPSAEILSKADLMEIPDALPLTMYYLGIFIFAETAFVLMALREYLQDLLHLEDKDLIAPEASGVRT